MSPDPRTLPIETLLADAGWVRALARRLVRDPSAADDLAQDALVAAWRHPPHVDTNARSWLARVVRNLVRQRRRSETARERREQGRPHPRTHEHDLVERAELAQRLARHVLALEEPYRTTVLQRFFEGHSAEEIAARSGVPSSTVRTRLERALAQLRATLEREQGREWFAALAPLAGIHTCTPVATGLAGGIAMGTGTKLALALCAAGVCGWILWPRGEPLAPIVEPPAPALAQANTALEYSAPVERTPQQAPPAAAPARANPKPARQAPSARTVEPGAIEGFVVQLSGAGEQPVEGAVVQVWRAGESPVDPPAPDEPPLATTRSGADGSFRFTRLEPGSYTLQGQRKQGPLRETRGFVPEQGLGVPVKLAFGVTRIHGRAYDEQGAPLANVPIRLDGGQEFGFEIRARATTDALGRYGFDELPAGMYFGLVTEDWQVQWPGRMWYLTLRDGDELELDLGEPRALPHWRGSVRSRGGTTVSSGGTIHLEHIERTRLGSEARTYREVLFDGGAAFDLRLERGSWSPAVSLRSKPDTRLHSDPIVIQDADLEQDLVLGGTRVHGTVIDSVTQKPLVGYTGTLQVSVRKAGTKHPGGLQSVDLEAGAQFAIDMLEPGQWEIVTYPLPVAAGGHSLGFTIGPNAPDVQIDVPVEKP